jgi:hypothetical protein
MEFIPNKRIILEITTFVSFDPENEFMASIRLLKVQ